MQPYDRVQKIQLMLSKGWIFLSQTDIKYHPSANITKKIENARLANLVNILTYELNYYGQIIIEVSSEPEKTFFLVYQNVLYKLNSIFDKEEQEIELMIQLLKIIIQN